MSKDFRELVLKHRGATVCVMGGADSLVEHLSTVSADVYISTNGHGAEVKPPDYVLAMDEAHSKLRVPMLGVIRGKTDAPIISPRPYADFQLADWPQCPRDVLSGMVATWAAWMLGAKVVLLAGMDGYGGDPGYVHEAVKMARDVHCPVRVIGGGPLTKAWPAYDPGEKFGRYKASTAIDAWLGKDGLVTVEVVKPTTVRQVVRAKGERLTLMRHEVARLLHHRMLREV